MSRKALLSSRGCFIALTVLMWAVPILGAAHVAQGATANGDGRRTAIPAPLGPSHLTSTIPKPVRFREVRDRGLLVRTWINGVGPFTFAVDTGAGITLVSESVVSQGQLSARVGRATLLGGLSGTKLASSRETLIEQIALGERNNFLPSRIVALIAPHLPSGIDGILDPTEAFSPLGYSIDMPAGLIEAFDPKVKRLSSQEAPTGGTVVRWLREKESRRPFVRLDDGRLALLDTGSGFGLAFADPSPTVASRSGQGVRDLAGGTIHSRRIAPTTVVIGSLVLRRVPTDLLTGVEKGAPVILGRDALYPFRITFDPLMRLIEIAPTADNDT